MCMLCFFFFSSRRRHTRFDCDWSSDVCSSDLDEATPKTAALLIRLATETALVPAWWFIEITNVFAMAERKGRITPAQSDAFIADLSKLGIERDLEAPDRALRTFLHCAEHID